MKKTEKIRLISIIMLIIAVLFAIKLTSEAVDYTTGGYVTTTQGLLDENNIGKVVGVNMYGTSAGGNTYVEGFQIRENKNFFCIEKGTYLHSGGFTIKANIVISEGMATLKVKDKNGKIVSYSSINSDTAKKENMILGEIIRQANGAKDDEEVRNRTSSDRKHIPWRRCLPTCFLERDWNMEKRI